MSIHFHSLKIKEVRKETSDCVSVLFDVPDDLMGIFQFHQGQSLTMKTILNGEEVRRTYSICSSPFDDQWRVAIKKVEGGIFSTFANDRLKNGDLLEVMPPVGKFYTELNSNNKNNYIAFAAGSGITPIISIIKTTLRSEPKSTFTLVFGNRNKNSIIFKEELAGIKDKFIDRFCVYHILSREKTDVPVNYGRIDAEKCAMLFDKLIDLNNSHEFFICGPEQMIFCIKDFLEQKGINSRNIHFELFTIPGEERSTVRRTPPTEDTGPKSKVGVKLDGIMFDFDLGYNHDSILDAALKQGADLPFACKGGVCCTCKAKLQEGRVEMDVNWGLEPEEIEQGFILTCQSHPKTERVIVDFDAR